MLSLQRNEESFRSGKVVTSEYNFDKTILEVCFLEGNRISVETSEIKKNYNVPV